MKKLLKFDKITLLLLSFIFFLFTLFYYLYKIDKSINQYNFHHNKIVTLELLNKDFDNFALSINRFNDYDAIDKKILRFKKEYALLQSSIDKREKRVFQKELADILKSFHEKEESINYFKSLNASLISDAHFLFDLEATIENEENITMQEKLLVNETLFYLLKFTTSDYITQKYIIQKLIKLEKINKKIKSKHIETFYKHTTLILHNTASIKEVASEIEKSPLSQHLKQLHQTLDKCYSEDLKIEKDIATLFFLITLVISLLLLKMYLHSLKTKESLMQSAIVYENSAEAIIIADANGKIVSINDAFTSIYGYTLTEVSGKSPKFLQSGDRDKDFYTSMWHQILSTGIWRGKFNNTTKSGEIIPVWSTIKQIKDENENIINYIALQTDLRELEESQARVNYLAYHDALTGLYNRAHFEEYLTHLLHHAKREESLMAIMFLDLDRFKVINDTLGHEIGDAVLFHTSKKIKETLRENDFISRWGGDEFVIIVEDITSASDVTHIATKLIEKIKEPMQIESHRLTITVSIGIALYPQDGNDANTLIKYADSAMYLAKERGKNNFCYYDDALSEKIQNRLNIDMELHNALKESEFHMVFQPQYRLKNSTIQSLEALIRWNNKRLGVVRPDIFIPIAEENGTIVEIGYFVFEASCRAFQEMRDANVPLEYIAINVSSVQFEREQNLLENFIAIAQKYHLEAKDIEIEVTERLIMDLSQGEENPLKKFRDAGFQISIDDFGTGYSSMSYLQYLPIDTIKIDKSFTDNINQENPSNAIIEAIIALSKTLHYQIVSEGIEEKEQEAFLREKGCDLGQGYLFSRPVTQEEIIERFTSSF